MTDTLTANEIEAAIVDELVVRKGAGYRVRRDWRFRIGKAADTIAKRLAEQVVIGVPPSQVSAFGNITVIDMGTVRVVGEYAKDDLMVRVVRVRTARKEDAEATGSRG